MKKKIILSTIIVVISSGIAHAATKPETKKIEVLQVPAKPIIQKPALPALQLIDQDALQAVIFTLDGNEIITQSDVMRPSLQGEKRNLDDILFETLTYLDAKKHKIEPDEDAVDRYLAKIMEENGITLQQMEEVFRQGGRSLKEGREELRKIQAVGSMIDFKIRSNLIVPRKDVEAYYAAHPEVKPARYSLRYVQIPFYKMMTKAEQQKDLMTKIRAEGIDFLGLSEPFWVTHGEIAEEKDFIYALKPDKISAPRPAQDGFELYYLVEKEEERTIPLEERYRDIVNTLLQPKYTQLLAEYRKKLFENASIIYFQ